MEGGYLAGNSVHLAATIGGFLAVAITGHSLRKLVLRVGDWTGEWLGRTPHPRHLARADFGYVLQHLHDRIIFVN